MDKTLSAVRFEALYQPGKQFRIMVGQNQDGDHGLRLVDRMAVFCLTTQRASRDRRRHARFRLSTYLRCSSGDDTLPNMAILFTLLRVYRGHHKRASRRRQSSDTLNENLLNLSRALTPLAVGLNGYGKGHLECRGEVTTQPGTAPVSPVPKAVVLPAANQWGPGTGPSRSILSMIIRCDILAR